MSGSNSIELRPCRRSGLTNSPTQTNSGRDCGGLRVRKLHRSNPERTDSPTHTRPDLPAARDPLHLAAGAAALDQERGGGARVGRIAVSPLEQTLVRICILSGV